jgi:hypothetical protein
MLRQSARFARGTDIFSKGSQPSVTEHIQVIFRREAMLRRILTVALLAISITAGLAQELGTSLLDLNKLPFFYGREYFVLRSGRAQMIVQADRADLGPAFTYLLFDAQNARQSQRKDRAFNFVPDKGFASSALEVILGEFPFTALGHRTETRWSDGGYDRYHTSVQPDQPGPWPFATCFIMRAQHEAGLYDRSRRALEWLNTVQGGRAGAWFEEIPSVRSLEKACGLVPWTSGEIALFVVRHWLGVSFEGSRVVLRPALFPGSAAVRANLRFRTARLQLQIDGAGAISNAQVNGVTIEPGADGALRLPSDFTGGHIIIHTK